MTSGGRRRYELKRRRDVMDATRRRIVEAAVALHGTVGPAQTTMSAVAGRAGVTRATLYRHFPTETDLFGACTRDWLGSHPPPDADAWLGVADPERRLRFALGEVYDWFARTESMTSNVLRDLEALPEANQARIAGRSATMLSALSAGWAEDDVETRAALAVAIAFPTWRTLVQAGRGTGDAANLMTRMVLAAHRG